MYGEQDIELITMPSLYIGEQDIELIIMLSMYWEQDIVTVYVWGARY